MKYVKITTDEYCLNKRGLYKCPYSMLEGENRHEWICEIISTRV